MKIRVRKYTELRRDAKWQKYKSMARSLASKKSIYSYLKSKGIKNNTSPSPDC